MVAPLAMESSEGVKANPYNNAYGVIRTLQAELNEMRAALHAEQEQRTREVGELKLHLANLQSSLHTHRGEQAQQHRAVNDSMLSESSQRLSAFEKLSAEVERERKHGQDLDIREKNLGTQLTRLLAELDKERRERLEIDKDLDERLIAEVAGRRDECKRLNMELKEQKANTDANFKINGDRIDSLAKNMQLAGDLLITTSSEEVRSLYTPKGRSVALRPAESVLDGTKTQTRASSSRRRQPSTDGTGSQFPRRSLDMLLV